MTYPDNPPYDGGPDEVVPTGGLSASGIAALAAKTAQDWEDELYGVADNFLTPISELLGKLWDLFAEFVDLDGFIEIVSDVLGFFYNLLDRAGFFDLLEAGVEFFAWLVGLSVDAIEELIKPIIEFLQWVWDLIGPTLQSLLQQVIDFLGAFLNPQQFVDLFNTIVDFFNGLFGGSLDLGGSVVDFVNKLPLIGPLVSAITGLTESDGVTLDLTTLGSWARGLEKQTTDGVSALLGAANRLLGGVIPVSQVGTSETNLLAQGDFLTSSTVDPAGGWAWDSTQTRTGTGGSLKVTCTGSSQRIYCRQDIKVTEGDRITLTGYVKTTGFSSGSMQLSLVPWKPLGTPVVMTQQTIVNGTARTTSAASWTALSSLSYTVPAGVTSVQVSLVTNCNSGATVAFDDIVLKKTGVLPQSLVTNLLDAINGILLGAGYVAGTGWTFLQTAVGLVTGTANDAFNNTEDTNTVLFNNPDGGTRATATGIFGAEINPTSGSGATLTRTGTTTYSATSGRNPIGTGFYNSLSSSTDITALTSGGNYTGQFQVSITGWYLCEIGYLIDPSAGYDWNIAPLLYKNGSAFRVGSDAMLVNAVIANAQRYSQSSFIVYLTNGQNVGAGYDASGAFTDIFSGSGTAVDTYFSVSLLNKTYS